MFAYITTLKATAKAIDTALGLAPFDTSTLNLPAGELKDSQWLKPLIAHYVGEANVKDVVQALPRWWRMYQGGNMWSGYPAYLAAMRDVIGLTGLDCWDKFAAWEACAIEGGFRIVTKDFCMVTDRPTILKMDNRNRPHSEDTPSHKWSDGWALYYIHGIAVTEQIVMRPETLTFEQISKEENAEIRRIMMERYGFERFLRESDATLLDECGEDHPMKGLRTAKLWRVKDVTLLDVLNSTPEPDGSVKRYVIPVDADLYEGRAGRECVAASASTWRMRGDRTQLVYVKVEDYQPVFES